MATMSEKYIISKYEKIRESVIVYQGIKLRRIGAGLYEIKGFVHATCGGKIRIERVGPGWLAWEAFCIKCTDCDPNGWPSLRQAAAKAKEFFG
jgi:hypothetical protein